jgi:vesicle coat complex subunit
MVWVIGQYADRIENSDALLEDFLYSFSEEPVEVQLALLTATVKLFIQRPTRAQELVPKVLKWATEETDNPDLRDRAYMYWRLLSTDMNAAKQIVMGEKPPITAEAERLEAPTLEEMCLNVGTLATIYLKPVQTVFRSARPRKLQDSPALQKQNLLVNTDNQKSISMFGRGGQPTNIDLRSRNAAPANGNGEGNLSQAVSDADAYFSNIGTQMSAMRIDQGEDMFGGNGGNMTGYVVSAHAPQAVLQPAQGAGSNGDLLAL